MQKLRSAAPHRGNEPQWRLTLRLFSKSLVGQAIVGAIVASVLGYILTFVTGLPFTDIWQLLFRDIGLYVLFVCVCAATTLVWKPRVIAEVIHDSRRSRPRSTYRLATSLFVIPVAGVIGSLVLRDGLFQNRQARLLFPQVWRLGPTTFGTYCTSGEVDVNVTSAESTVSGGPDGFATIVFKLGDAGAGNGCGWVIYLPLGLGISHHREFRFLIRGERGGEQVRVKAKDASGVERTVSSIDLYLPDRKMTTSWQQASIPFQDFGPGFDWGFMDNLSFFVAAEATETRPLTIHVGNFQLR